jgi:hypothetical protein
MRTILRIWSVCALLLLPLFLLSQTITVVEYFIDTDPGVGNGTAVSITPSGTIVLNESLDISGVAPGFHYLYIRAQDSDGDWSLHARQSFYVSDTSSIAQQPLPDIIAGEYFFDQDPGPGNGYPFSVSSPDSLLNLNENLPLPSDISLGEHYIGIRFKDERGSWSLFSWDTITVVPPPPCDGVEAPETASCSGEMLMQMTTDVPGGSWSAISSIGTTVDQSGNVTLGTNSSTSNDQDTIVYSAIGCADTVFVTVFPQPIITASETASCSGGMLMQMTANLSGGTWSTMSNIGTSVDQQGYVTLGTNTTTSNDQDTITYTTADGCVDFVWVTVYPTPSITASETASCSGEILAQMTADVSGGSWSALSSIGTSVDQLGNVTLGTNTTGINDQDTIIYTANGCADSVFVTIYPTPEITAPETASCSNEMLAQMTANIPGGSWSTISSIGTIVDQQGNVTLGTNTSMMNVQDTIVYTANGCAGFVLVTAFPAPAITASETASCSGEMLPQMTVNAPGGTWSAISSIGTTVDQMGNVTLGINTTINSDQDTILYTANGCTNSLFVTVSPIPSITAGTLDSTSCPKQIQMTADVPGGSWSVISNNGTSVDQMGTVTLGANTGTTIDQDTIIYVANGCADSVFITIEPTPIVIVAAEYFIDIDPGPRNGESISVTPAARLCLNETLDVSGVDPGFHYLYIRGRDNQGLWSLQTRQAFYISDTTSIAAQPIPDIVAGEYFFDEDPGPGNGFPVPISNSGSLLNLDEDLPLPASVTVGEHYMGIRFKDDRGSWSHFSSDTILVVTPPPCEGILILEDEEVSGYYQAGDSLITMGEVSVQDSATFTAGIAVVLKAGFEVLDTNTFHAFISACTTLDNPEKALAEVSEGEESLFRETNHFEARLFPNPACTEVQLAFHLPNEAEVMISLHNSSGQILSLQQQTLASGNHQTQVDVTSLPAGFYVVRIEVGEEVVVKKVLVNR